MEVKPVEIGGRVVYVDSVAAEHDALVTAVWGQNLYGCPGSSAFGDWTQEEADWCAERGNPTPVMVGKPKAIPSLNVVFVSGDEAKGDPYGRQIERATSVPHHSVQPAHGNYWRNLTGD